MLTARECANKSKQRARVCERDRRVETEHQKKQHPTKCTNENKIYFVEK